MKYWQDWLPTLPAQYGGRSLTLLRQGVQTEWRQERRRGEEGGLLQEGQEDSRLQEDRPPPNRGNTPDISVTSEVTILTETFYSGTNWPQTSLRHLLWTVHLRWFSLTSCSTLEPGSLSSCSTHCRAPGFLSLCVMSRVNTIFPIITYKLIIEHSESADRRSEPSVNKTKILKFNKKFFFQSSVNI